MNRGKNPQRVRVGGYTIVETLIFLAVSAAMFVSAAALISGQQSKAQFVNAVHDFESQLTDVANNVSTGYYQDTANFSCTTVGGNAPVIGAPSAQDTIGAHGDCIFVGTVLKLGNGGANSESSYSLFTMAGTRLDSASNDVSTLATAKPVPVRSTVVDGTFSYGTVVSCIKINAGACTAGNAAIGFFTKLQGSSTQAQGQGDVIRTDLIPYSLVTLNDTTANTATKIDTSGTANYSSTPPGLSSPAVINPQSVTICLLSGQTNQYAMVSLSGAAAGSLSITTVIKGGNSCT